MSENKVTWNDLTTLERRVLTAMPDEWTPTFNLPPFAKERILSTVLPMAMREVVIESRGDNSDDKPIEYRRTATGRALVEAHVVTNENGLPVALADGWQHVGDVKASTDGYDKDSRIQHLLSDRNDMLSDEQKIHEQLALIDRNVDESVVVCVEELVREFAQLKAERDALKAENATLSNRVFELERKTLDPKSLETVKFYIRAGKKIDAIKTYRAFADCLLVEARDAVEAMEIVMRQQGKALKAADEA